MIIIMWNQKFCNTVFIRIMLFTFETSDFHKLFLQTCNLHFLFLHVFRRLFGPKSPHDSLDILRPHLPVLQRNLIIRICPNVSNVKNFEFLMSARRSGSNFYLISYFCFNVLPVISAILMGIFVFLDVDSFGKYCEVNLIFK